MKKIIIGCLIVVLTITGIIIYNNSKNEITNQEVKNELKPGITLNEFDKLMLNYSNDKIVAFIEIPDVFIEPVVQSDDNEYYLNHDLNGNEDINGSIYLDYRLKIKDNNKILIYGHSDPDLSLPFAKLANYNDKSFYEKHPNILLHTKEKTYEFNIFASYVEVNDFDYINIKNFNGLTWLEHLNKLKSYSQYETNVEISDNKKVIILQTCSFDSKYQSYEKKYRLVIGIEK